MEFTGGWGFCKTQKFKEMCEALLEFLEGWGFLEKIPSVWRYGYFLEQHNITRYFLKLPDSTRHVIESVHEVIPFFIYRVQKLFICKDDEDQSPMKFYFGHYISCQDPKTKDPAMKV